MPQVVIPLVVDQYATPLGGLTVPLGDHSGIGELPPDLHAASIERQKELLQFDDLSRVKKVRHFPA
jgi:hypothetical protein